MSKKNPYSPKFVTRHGEPLADNLRFRNQSQPAIASSGSMNASSRKDLMSQIGQLITAYSRGDIHRTAAVARSDKRQVSKERKTALVQAIADGSGETWKALGEVIAEDIYETTGREGFVRKLMAFKELEQGEIARVRFRTRDVVAFTAASATEVTPIFVRDNYQFPPEFYIGGNILVEERDIHQSTGDILEEKYNEGLEAIMTQEDRLWKRMADDASKISNTLTYFTTFTPMHFTQIKSQVTGWGIPASYCIMAYDLWDDMIGTTGFSDWFDPVHQHELILEGELGSMLGLSLLTDAFRLPELKVLEPGELYVVGAPETHGSIQQRGDLSSNPINKYDDGKPTRGWYIFEILTMALVNTKSIAGGKRS
jgi:hypothetical protein